MSRKSRAALLFVSLASCAPSVPVECVLVDFSDFSETPILSADLVINGVANEELAYGLTENLFCAGPHKQLNHSIVCRLPEE